MNLESDITMPRGRPKAQPKIDPSELEGIVANILVEYCSTPGCMAKHHLEEVREILKAIENYVTRSES